MFCGNIKKLYLKFRHNKGALAAIIILFVIFLATIFSFGIVPYKPSSMSLAHRMAAPSLFSSEGFPHILGTDEQGRDIFSRILCGGQVTLKIGFLVTSIGAVLGTALGLFAGYFGGWVDMIVMRIVDVWASSPTFLISLTFVMVMGPGVNTLIIAFLFTSWTLFCKMARSQALTIRSSTMVESGQAIGASTNRILFRHIVPNIISPMITTYVLQLANFINAESNLSFLGFGVQPPATSWGLIIGDGKEYITSAWWIVFFPGLLIGITVLCLNIVGNWVREEFDPLSVKI